MTAVDSVGEPTPTEMAAAAESAGAATTGAEEPSTITNSRLPATDMPAVIEVTSKGLPREQSSGSSRSCSFGCGGDGASGGDAAAAEVAERRAIADVFRKVDLDASGHVSQEELVEAVSARSSQILLDRHDRREWPHGSKARVERSKLWWPTRSKIW